MFISHIYYIIHYLFFSLLGGMGVRGFSPKVNLVQSFLAVERGLTCFPCHFTNYILQAIQNTEVKCTKTMIMNRHIGILSFTFVSRWEENVCFILLQLLTVQLTWNFYFVHSFLPPELIWDSLYCRGMRYHLHVRGHITLTNYKFHVHVESVSLFTTIFVILTNTDMQKVQNSTILEGLEYPILSRRGFVKVTPKAGRVSSTFLLPPELIWCPPYARGLKYHQPFRGHVRLTNDNFHAHVHLCITIDYHRYSIHRLMTCHADLQ